MKLFIERELKSQIPLVIWRDGDRILSVIWGVQYIQGTMEGIYRTILRTWRTPGLCFIEIPGLLIILMSRRPYIYFEKSKGLEIYEDQVG